MNNNKGFTLIEMLVVIAIIVALSVSAGLSADFSMRKARKNDYKDTYYELFKAVDVYSELSSFSCTTLDTGCNVTIANLITKGLIDEKIITEINPIYKKGTVKFKTSSTFVVKKINGVKSIQFSCVTSDSDGSNCNKNACKISLYGLYNSGSLDAATSLEKYHKNDYWENC